MEKYKKIAGEILKLSKNRICADIRVLCEPLEELEFMPLSKALKGEEWFLVGSTVHYEPECMVQEFRKEPAHVSRDVLHILLHCLLGHPFRDKTENAVLWELATDMAVEGMAMEIFSGCILEKDTEKREQYDRISDYAGGNSAEVFYNYFVDKKLTNEEASTLFTLFHVDSHEFWFQNSNKQSKGGNSKAMEPMDGAGLSATDSEEDLEQEQRQTRGNETSPDFSMLSEKKRKNEKQKWKKISRKVKTDIEMFHKNHSFLAGNFLEQLKLARLEEISYQEFLRTFTRQKKMDRLSEDAYDPIYYTYGLMKYGNIPLIEPLEYREEKKIRSFAIAVDTSGSVQGEIVKDFLKQTFQMLLDTGNFADEVCIYLIQCDSRIQDCKVIHSMDEVSSILKNYEIKGFGGTDFTPVFTYLNELQNNEKSEELEGLIYFTDGIGTFPESEPPYRTVFIFDREDRMAERIPGWAIKAVLSDKKVRYL